MQDTLSEVEVTKEPEATNTVADKPEVPETKDAQEKAEKKANPLQARIDELTRARHEAEREAQYYRTVAEQSNKREAEQRPAKDSFATDDEYVEALTEWKARKAVTAAMAERDAQRAESAKQDAMSTKAETFAQRAALFKATAEDFDEVMESAEKIRVSQSMREAILDSEYGPQISYHLAKNPDEAAKIAAMEYNAAARAIGRIEAKIEAGKQSAKTTNAPDPVTPVRGSGGKFVRDESAMSDAEWYAARNKK